LQWNQQTRTRIVQGIEKYLFRLHNRFKVHQLGEILENVLLHHPQTIHQRQALDLTRYVWQPTATWHILRPIQGQQILNSRCQAGGTVAQHRPYWQVGVHHGPESSQQSIIDFTAWHR
jgi:hypothetical protein